MRTRFTFFPQLDSRDCGPACLQMVCNYYGKSIELPELRDLCFQGNLGVSLLSISSAAEKIGLRTIGGKLTFEKLVEKTPLPCIIYWDQKHFVVVTKVVKTQKGHKVLVADPGKGLIWYDDEEFNHHWIGTLSNGESKGVLLLLEPTQLFYENSCSRSLNPNRLRFLWRYVKKYNRFAFQLILGLLFGSILQLTLPFLTQAIVDTGIKEQNLNFIWLVLIAQLMLIFSRSAIGFFRNKILLHISTRINISLISDFFIKLMKLPMKFFETKLMGDLIQRIEDHRRIDQFLTNQTINLIFSGFSFIVFGIVLLIYSRSLKLVYFIGY